MNILKLSQLCFKTIVNNSTETDIFKFCKCNELIDFLIVENPILYESKNKKNEFRKLY